MVTVLVWVGWLYLGGVIYFTARVGLLTITRASLSRKQQEELENIPQIAVYMTTLGWPVNLARLAYMRAHGFPADQDEQ